MKVENSINGSVVHYGTMMLERAGTERTAVRFSIDGSGAVQEVIVAKSLLRPRRWRSRCRLRWNCRGNLVLRSPTIAGALLLVIALRARVSPLLGAVLVTSAFYGVTFFRIEGLTGWSGPRRRAIPAVVGADRRTEPTRSGSGAVHLGRGADAANLPERSAVPTACPYSAALAAR